MSEPDSAVAVAEGHSFECQLTSALTRHMSEELLAVDRSGKITYVLGAEDAAIGPSAVGSQIFDHLHPEDLPAIVRFALDGLKTAPGWEGVGCARLQMPSGDWLYHEVHAVNKTDDPVVQGFVVRLCPMDAAHPEPTGTEPTGTEPTGTEPTGTEPTMVEHELETLAGAVPLPILFLDHYGSAYFVNDAAHELCAGLLARLGTEGLPGIADLRDRSLVEETVHSLVETGGERTITFRLLPLRIAAEERVVEATFSAQRKGPRAREGALVHSVVATLVDVTAHHARESELRRMASCDPLTGLLNRTEIEDALGERLRSAPERVALLYCDLDGFKAVNDNHGHDVGDELLVEIAQILEAKTRPGDLVGRLGGDEFAVLVDSPDPADAHGLACRIAIAIAELSSYRRLPVSASVGAATARGGDTTRDLLRRADAAMYDEKRRRRVAAGRAV